MKEAACPLRNLAAAAVVRKVWRRLPFDPSYDRIAFVSDAILEEARLPVITSNHHIESTLGTVGGKPRIVGRRITVQDVVIRHELQRLTADDIATEFDLSLADVYAALTYYFDNQAEIDNAMAAENAFVEALGSTSESKIDRGASRRQ